MTCEGRARAAEHGRCARSVRGARAHQPVRVPARVDRELDGDVRPASVGHLEPPELHDRVVVHRGDEVDHRRQRARDLVVGVVGRQEGQQREGHHGQQEESDRLRDEHLGHHAHDFKVPFVHGVQTFDPFLLELDLILGCSFHKLGLLLAARDPKPGPRVRLLRRGHPHPGVAAVRRGHGKSTSGFAQRTRTARPHFTRTHNSDMCFARNSRTALRSAVALPARFVRCSSSRKRGRVGCCA